MPGPTAPFLAAMLAWAAQTTGLPMTAAPPVVVTAETPLIGLHGLAEGGVQGQMVDGTVYLHPGWRQGDPLDDCLLAHELVHVLQYAARKPYRCVNESERLAYAAQELCLAQRGVDFWQAVRWRPSTLAPLMECPSH